MIESVCSSRGLLQAVSADGTLLLFLYKTRIVPYTLFSMCLVLAAFESDT